MSGHLCAKCGVDVKNRKSCKACGTLVIFLVKDNPLESKIKADIRLALVQAGAICWVHNVDNRNLSTGLGIGTADLICVVPPYGRFLGIEVKRPSGSRTADAQKAWLAVVRKFGGVSGIARNVEEALVLLEEARHAGN